MFSLFENAIKAERTKHEAECAKHEAERAKQEAEIQKLKHQIASLEQKAKYFEHLFVQERHILQKALLTTKRTKH